MAQLRMWISSETTIAWRIEDLQWYWNSVNYTKAVISTGATTNGSTTLPSGILDTVTAPSHGTNFYTSTGYLTGSAGQIYTRHGYVQAPNGRWWYCV